MFKVKKIEPKTKVIETKKELTTLVNIDLLTDQQIDFSKNPILQDIKLQIKRYEKVSMNDKAKQMEKKYSEVATAMVLEGDGKSLLHFQTSVYGRNELKILKGDGKKMISDSGWNCENLKNYIGDIPKHILDDMPQKLADKKTFVFSPSNDPDPIVAIHLKDNYYVGVYQWE